MNVQLNRIDDLHGQLTVQITPEDYKPKYQSELDEYRKKSQLKGFRKGKTPIGYIRKVYGKAVLAETVNELLQKAVFDYLTDHEIDFLGQPLASSDQEPLDFDTKEMGDYIFKFDLGLAPKFELQGLDGEVGKYDVTVPEDMVEEEWTTYRKRLGTLQPADDVQPDDILYIIAREMEGDVVREEGWESSFAIRVDDLAEEATQKQVLDQQGGKFRFTLDKLEKDKDADYVKKYHLGLEDEPGRIVSDKFEAEVEKVQRMQLAETDQAFLDKVFGEGRVTSAEEGQDKIRADLKAHFDRQADALVYKEMQKHLMAANDLPLPEDFLHRWLHTQDDGDEHDDGDHDHSDMYNELRWQLIKDKIAKRNNLTVTEEEIADGAVRRVYQYMGPYADQDRIRSLAETVLRNEDQVRRISGEIMANKIFDVLKETFTINPVPIDKDAFEEKAREVLGSKS